ncbi:FecR domain-containing protein [Mucilaginibacter gynuensis]|uniref:FecR domain-containing protein n=1 Tax=Mucilaginibacter gynuensis TaxID=1302236 RepID=A0ABP8G657_9SPHI
METSSNNEQERALLKKYLAGNCTPEERERVESWYQSFEQSPLPGTLQEKHSVKKVKNALLGQIRADRSGKSKVFRLPVYLRVAALLTLVISVSILIYRAAHIPNEQMMEYRAANGQFKVITLPDSSVVTLNSGSSLVVRSNFGQNTREVSLSGEAYFQVTKDRTRPFIVSTGIVKTRVLGTAFNVQAYKNENDLTVTVAEGKVRVDQDAGQSNQANLSPGVTPGKQLIYNKTTHNAKTIAADAQHVSAWRTGVLYFDNESIPAIARKLERKFNISIGVTGKISPDCRYTFRISDETLVKTLKLLGSVSGISYKFNQPKQLIINTTACK